MSESPVVEMTALDAQALRELVEGLMAEVRALRIEVERLGAEPRQIIVQQPITAYPLGASSHAAIAARLPNAGVTVMEPLGGEFAAIWDANAAKLYEA